MHNKKIQTQISDGINGERYKNFTGSMGVIISHDRFTNTATVLISKTETDEPEEILKNVPCPTQIGIQAASPEPGRPCYVVFRNGNITQPLITHYYNHRYDKFDYQRQIPSQYNLPSYLLG